MSTTDIVNAQWKYVERKKEKEEEKEKEREEGREMKAHAKKQMDEKSPQLIMVSNIEDCSSLFSYGEIIGTLMFWSWISSSPSAFLWRKAFPLILFKPLPWGGVHGSAFPCVLIGWYDFHPSAVLLCPLKSESESEVTQSCPTLCNPMDTRLLCPWDFLGKSTGVGCHFLLQGTGNWDRTQVSHIVDRRFTIWATREVFLMGFICFIGLPW